MDIINEFNLRSGRTYFEKVGTSKHAISVNSGQVRRQYRLKLLETETITDKETAKASLPGLQAIMALRIFVRENVGISKVLKERMLAWQEIKA
ncbi:hypothetical protein FXW07_10835 [Methanosarcina sp. DH1]|uniref:hypothetical protein n=1 Tax=Methanosarcina sp. DH1 TaxID=2605695 RepID=UPI001E320EAF|nr:hypothetical protein [Methanosarcina sp. DH1]MCC4767097.1 hypothetical protein [Methanosarcina sp. DH1]